MYYDNKDKRIPLNNNDVVVINDIVTNRRIEYVIDSLAGAGGFALMYIAHEKNTHHYVALKELFPQALEDAVAERRLEDGKIVIYNPMVASNDYDDQAIWEQITPFFEREVQLTRKAATVYDSNGNIIPQNNPDVFGVYGPFVSENGNRYVAIETQNGKSLQQFIDNGWESDVDKGVYRNNLLSEVIDLLIKVTQRLTVLHGDYRMYHLDLSPSNIYVSYLRGLDLEPTIIDYGSAYNRNDPEDLTAHRFTCNPYSAPEVKALAEINDQNAGYYVDVTSDTYNLVAILFYAVLGELYTAQKIYDSSWRIKVRELYPKNVYNDFADKLIDFFDHGLSSDQNERYVTIQPSINRKQDSLCSALIELKKAYETKTADILSAIPDDELMSYLILDKYPLFRYFKKNKDIHVLCLGSGVFVNRMILSIISTGQMINRKLYIHVVSGDAEQYRQRLLRQAPMLKEYVNLGNNEISEENTFATITFETVTDLTNEDICQKVAVKYGELCRYVVISLGANNDNITLARRFANEVGNISNAKTIINYYMAEDSALNVRADEDEASVPHHIKVIPFGNLLASYNKDVHKLGMKAFRVSYLYERLYNRRVSKDTALRKFIADEYAQRSSTAAAVHIDYKLESLGINTTDPRISKRSISKYQSNIIDTYNSRVLLNCDQETNSSENVKKRKGITSKEYGLLLQLEHIRWMMFMIADGYRLATSDDHERYSFRMVGDKFNKAFKCTDRAIKTHHCLVPCGGDGVKLPRDHSEWDKYNSIDEIEQSEYDALDKASLTVHLLAKQRMERPATVGRIKSIVENDLIEKLYLAPNEIELKAEYENFKKWIFQVLRHKSLDRINVKLQNLKEKFALYEIDISDIVAKLTNELSIFAEFHKYNDYKAPDCDIIDNLLWIKFDDDVTMLKVVANSVLSNIATPLIIEPKKLIYIGEEPQAHLLGFFDKHISNTKVSFEQCELNSIDNAAAILKQMITQSENYVIDVTDANPFVVIASVRLATANKNIAVISYNSKDSSISNIMNYPCASIHRLKTFISANEIFELYGAQEKTNKDSYMLGLTGYMDRLWEFYRNHSDEWEMISSFFEGFGRGSSEFHISDLPIDVEKWSTFKRQISFDICQRTGIFDALRKMENIGIIKNYVHLQTEAFSNISFMYPVVAQGKFNNVFMQKFSELLNSLGDSQLVCTIKPKRDNVFDIDIMSGYKVFRNFKQSGKFTNKIGDKEFEVSAMEAPLKELEQLQMLSALEFRMSVENCYISFVYNSTAIRDCLIIAGNILEAYVWYEARKTGYFDSLQTNFSFTWSNPNVSNELDVILTHGLTTLICSCKTSKFNKEHLYEIAYLANRYSVNTKPVIIYSSDKMVEDGKIFINTDAVRERAKEMGIYLIDKETLNTDLGAELIRIAEDTRS